jgi:hypothetical protein
MSVHSTIHMKIPHAGTTSRPAPRRTASCALDRSVVIREAGYRTRVSATRHLAGCATERFVAIGWRTRKTHTHGVHVAGRTLAHRKLGFGPAPDSA